MKVNGMQMSNNKWRHVEMSEWISSVYSDYMLFVYNKQR